MKYATQKDIDRAEGLRWRGKTFDGGCSGLKESNARKMAKLITNPTKVVARFEACVEVWGLRSEIAGIFAKRISELCQGTKFGKAYINGKYAAATSMSPPQSPGDEDPVVNMLYGCGVYSENRF